MNALRSALFQLLFYGLTAVAAVLLLPVLLLPRGAILGVGRLWSRAALWLLARTVGLHWRLRGAENMPAGPAIFALKHQSAWDTLMVSLLVRDPAIVVKRELFSIPLFGWYMAKAGEIAVSRSAGVGALRRLVVAARGAVAAGRPVALFPEGTRCPPGATPDYQPGVAALYRELGLPVVPVALNSGLFWPRRRFCKLPGRITVEVLPAIAPGLDRRAFMAKLEARIETATAALTRDAIAEFGLPPLSTGPAATPL